jgi:transcription elongation GreA/GreB family factor
MLNIVTKAFPGLYVKETVSLWDDESVLYFSRSGLRRMEAERDELVNVKMRENAKAIGEAASHGDLSENSEYKFALEERDLLRARLAQMNRELTLARILEPDDVPTDHVSIGQRLTLVPEAGGEPIALTIAGVGDSDLQRHAYAYQTPLARQLLGKRLGETATLSLDGAGELVYRIEQIEKAVDGPSGVSEAPSAASAEVSPS